MHDYTYPSVYLAYLMFFLCLAGAIFFLVRSRHSGYWGAHSEDPKYRMLSDGERDDESDDTSRNTN
jgi:hypothetical protein